MHTNQDLPVFRQVLLFAAGSWEKREREASKRRKFSFLHYCFNELKQKCKMKETKH